MSCCAPTANLTAPPDPRERDRQETMLASRDVGDGSLQTDLSVPTVHCVGCIRAIETALANLPGVQSARVNLTTKHVAIRWDRRTGPPPFIATLRGIGFPAHLHDVRTNAKDKTFSSLLRALAVAGFASSNIMLLSVSVWMGADEATRDIFHWISAVIALVTLIYSGRTFFVSAWSALKRWSTNMDVPISVGVLMAYALSLYETIHHGQHAYFDATVSLLFVLLVGRTLDHMMREKARTAIEGLARLAARGALVEQPDQGRVYMPVEEIRPGMTILLAAGERVPVDGQIVEGRSALDSSLVSGESTPVTIDAGSLVQAGALNLSSPVTMISTASATDSFLAEMTRLIETAEAGRVRYRRMADRAARLYAPVVHSTAALAFAGWLIATGDMHRAATVAIAVLIVTCPCALGLAVPMVQAIAARRLFENGILLKSGSALERLVEVDIVVFDKTGTLTLGTPRLINSERIEANALRIAAAMASRSHHPYSRTLAALQVAAGRPLSLTNLTEHPGCGIEATIGTDIYRLGNPAWVLGQDVAAPLPTGIVLGRNGERVASFDFEDELRPAAAETVSLLRASGLSLEIVSGDRRAAVQRIADILGIPFRAQVDPARKVAYIEKLRMQGRKILMVGDGINDAPALAGAHVSIAPGSAADIGRAAADLVFLRDSLLAVPHALSIAKRADNLVRQNLWIAALYNILAVPLALTGLVTPLIAAIAMSLSSLTVVANSLRLRDTTFWRPAPTRASELCSARLDLKGSSNG